MEPRGNAGSSWTSGRGGGVPAAPGAFDRPRKVPAGGGGSPPPFPPPEPSETPWLRTELAWPLSIAAGFLGTWLGLVAGVPVVPAALATALYAPFYLRLLRRDRPAVAAATSIAWMVAIVFTVAGVVLQSSPEAAREGLLFSEPVRLARLGLTRGSSAGAARSTQLAVQALAGLLILLLARPTRGVGALFAVALALGAVSGGAADWTARAGGAGGESPTDPLAAVLAGWPPGPLFALSGLLLAGVSLADPRRLLPLSELALGRRRMLQGGALLAAAALFFEPLYAPAWWRLVALL